MHHQSPVKYINCSPRFSHQDYPALKQVFAGWGVIEPLFDHRVRSALHLRYDPVAGALSADRVGDARAEVELSLRVAERYGAVEGGLRAVAVAGGGERRDCKERENRA